MRKTVRSHIPLEFLYYLAGYVDKAGTFSIFNNPIRSSKYDRWTAKILLTCTDKEFIRGVERELYEIVNPKKTYEVGVDYDAGNGTIHKQYNLSLEGPLLDKILPHFLKVLRRKKRQAELLLEYRETIKTNRLGNEEVDRAAIHKRMELSEEMRSLAKRTGKGLNKASRDQV